MRADWSIKRSPSVASPVAPMPKSRPSAGIMSPRRRTITSPGTRALVSSSTRWPLRQQRVLSASVCRRASRADSALASSMNPILALTSKRARIIPKSSQSYHEKKKRARPEHQKTWLNRCQLVIVVVGTDIYAKTKHEVAFNSNHDKPQNKIKQNNNEHQRPMQSKQNKNKRGQLKHKNAHIYPDNGRDDTSNLNKVSDRACKVSQELEDRVFLVLFDLVGPKSSQPLLDFFIV